ncbi:MAG: PIG-L family deacetylase [Chitinivibrionales bacterium]|nr:PIG-L family deacetylase [Chitinivibrionales bacterium]
MASAPNNARALVVVAHPDDETLWAGGALLDTPRCDWHIAALCRASDPDRAPRFRRAVEQLGARGSIGDLDDSPGQNPLPVATIEQTILSMLPEERFDRILTHSPNGEYTRHRRHEQTAWAVIGLWCVGRLKADELLLFAYEDGYGAYLPKAIENASVYATLEESTWQTKYRIITETYGFAPTSFEARTTPRAEAFWKLTCRADARAWLTMEAYRHESTRTI